MSHESFFLLFGKEKLQADGIFITVEQMFQAFKSRMMAEVVVETKEAEISEWSGRPNPYTRELRPLIDKPEEL